jgi:ADP-dependent NAD(P)H-hydrate dehydratase / NAD(P)H-hydrate epimerase
MEKAGLAAAELARQLLGDNGTAVLVLAGPGNNGGDAFVVARHLKQWWYRVTTVFAGERERLPDDARSALDQYLEAGGDLLDAIPEQLRWDLVIDGLFGIGLQRDLSDRFLRLVQRSNALRLPVLSLDVPSGVDADTGAVRGAAVRADHSVTFLALKPGLLTGDGVDCSGQIHVATLGVDAEALLESSGHRIDTAVVRRYLPPRARNSHKGSFGSVGILGGSSGMAGAALLAATAALKCGAGRVYLGLLTHDPPAFDTKQPELMFRPADEMLDATQLSCLVVGPGMGKGKESAALLGKALLLPLPLVLGADALNILAESTELKALLKSRAEDAILTPHPAEAARLLKTTTVAVQRDRISAACKLAEEFDSLVVLKGAGSICAYPAKQWAINTSGNAGMSSAGMGDVLSGILGALLAQGVSADRALPLAVHLHGAAADHAVRKGLGPVGLTASEVTDAARTLLNQWVYGEAHAENSS